mmetsp:Transcript_726/g.2585  ORF Transcript_726/g.2585 Transcript_726/m.2585 type:complete len:330 (-) Transcript_726:1615-2604(-)
MEERRVPLCVPLRRSFRRIPLRRLGRRSPLSLPRIRHLPCPGSPQLPLVRRRSCHAHLSRRLRRHCRLSCADHSHRKQGRRRHRRPLHHHVADWRAAAVLHVAQAEVPLERHAVREDGLPCDAHIRRVQRRHRLPQPGRPRQRRAQLGLQRVLDPEPRVHGALQGAGAGAVLRVPGVLRAPLVPGRVLVLRRLHPLHAARLRGHHRPVPPPQPHLSPLYGPTAVRDECAADGPVGDDEHRQAGARRHSVGGASEERRHTAALRHSPHARHLRRERGHAHGRVHATAEGTHLRQERGRTRAQQRPSPPPLRRHEGHRLPGCPPRRPAQDS